MQALAIRCKLALSSRISAACGFVLLALFPRESALFHAALVVIVLRVIRPTLALHLARQTSFGASIGLQLLAERFELHVSLLGNDGKTGWADVYPNGIRPDGVPRFLVGTALKHKLHTVAVALAICTPGLRTGGFATNETSELETLFESMAHNRVMPID